LSTQTLEQLKIRLLDAIGGAIAALTAPPIVAIGAFMDEAPVALQHIWAGSRPVPHSQAA
jgi:2-methylcitrate dehydratase PrpD